MISGVKADELDLLARQWIGSFRFKHLGLGARGAYFRFIDPKAGLGS